MKSVINYTLNTCIAFLLLLVGQFCWSQGLNMYYAYAPIENFYQQELFHAEDVCIGDTTQIIHSKRFVYGTKDGYGGSLIREMYLLKDDTVIKILDENAMPFVEVRVDGLVTRQQNLPYLALGDYKWILYLTLDIHGVQRTIPPIESNIFKVKECV